MKLLEDYSEDSGMGEIGYNRLSEYFTNAWEFASSIGKKSTGILDLYLLAFELAQENLKKQEA